MPTPRRGSPVTVTYVVCYILAALGIAALATPMVMLALNIPGDASPLMFGLLGSITTTVVALCLIYHRAAWLLLGVPTVLFVLAITLEITWGLYRGWPGSTVGHLALVLGLTLAEVIAVGGIWPFRVHGTHARWFTARILTRLRQFPIGTILACEPDILFTVGASEHHLARSTAHDSNIETFSFAPLGAAVACSRTLDPTQDVVTAMLIRYILLLLRRPVPLHPVSDAELGELHAQFVRAVPVEA